MNQSICIVTAIDREKKWIYRNLPTEALQHPFGASLKRVQGSTSLPIFLLTTGPGKVNAATTLQSMLSDYPVGCVVLVGIAGSVDPEVHRGDLVLASRIAYHDFGSRRSEGFTRCRLPVRSRKSEKPGMTLSFTPSDRLSEIALETCRKLDSKPGKPTGGSIAKSSLHLGTIATGDQVIMNPEFGKSIAASTGALVCDMESAAIAHVCEMNSIPFVVVRVISDEILKGTMDRIPFFSGPDILDGKRVAWNIGRRPLAGLKWANTLRDHAVAFGQTCQLSGFIGYHVAVSIQSSLMDESPESGQGNT